MSAFTIKIKRLDFFLSKSS